MVAVRVSHDATKSRRRLGRLLRQARDDAGRTQAEAADELGCQQAKINKIESTLVSISVADVDKLIEFYGVAEGRANELRELARQDQVNGPKRRAYPPAWKAYAELSDYEPEAREILCWHSERIPVPLQSERYRLELYGVRTRPEVLDVLSALKLRTKIFTMSSPPRYRAILSESSLHRMPGGRSSGLVVDEAERLLWLTDNYEHFELHILTFDADVRYVDSDFVILRPRDEEVSDFAYVECPGGSRKFQKRGELREFQQHWDMLRAAALSRADSRQFLSKLVEKGGRLDS